MKKAVNSKIPRLFELMTEKAVKAVTLGTDLGISTGNISDWKSGKSLPSAGALAAIADYLGTTPDYLLGKTNEKEKPTAGKATAAFDASGDLSEQERLIIEKYRSASAEDKFKIIAAIVSITDV